MRRYIMAMSIDPLPTPKARTVWAVTTRPATYERIRAIAKARGISNAMVIRLAMDALENLQPVKETRNA
jgi:hypothetical protein